MEPQNISDSPRMITVDINTVGLCRRCAHGIQYHLRYIAFISCQSNPIGQTRLKTRLNTGVHQLQLAYTALRVGEVGNDMIHSNTYHIESDENNEPHETVERALPLYILFKAQQHTQKISYKS